MSGEDNGPTSPLSCHVPGTDISWVHLEDASKPKGEIWPSAKDGSVQEWERISSHLLFHCRGLSYLCVLIQRQSERESDHENAAFYTPPDTSLTHPQTVTWEWSPPSPTPTRAQSGLKQTEEPPPFLGSKVRRLGLLCTQEEQYSHFTDNKMAIISFYILIRPVQSFYLIK